MYVILYIYGLVVCQLVVRCYLQYQNNITIMYPAIYPLHVHDHIYIVILRYIHVHTRIQAPLTEPKYVMEVGE